MDDIDFLVDCVDTGTSSYSQMEKVIERLFSLMSSVDRVPLVKTLISDLSAKERAKVVDFIKEE